MSMNGISTVDDAEMADDGEKLVTMMDVLEEQQEFEDDANAVLGASDDKNCTYSKGVIKRQAIYACLTCCTEAKTDPLKRAGVCLACSLHCHENHDLVELYTKRNFRCDCGNPNFNSNPCYFTPNKTELNEDNVYDQNFSGLYCVCHRPYPDPEIPEEEEMIQCIICEDWLHASHLEATVPAHDQYAEMICKGCMEKNEFLHDYSMFAVNIVNDDIDIVTVNGVGAAQEDKDLGNGQMKDAKADVYMKDEIENNDKEPSSIINGEEKNGDLEEKPIENEKESLAEPTDSKLPINMDSENAISTKDIGETTSEHTCDVPMKSENTITTSEAIEKSGAETVSNNKICDNICETSVTESMCKEMTESEKENALLAEPFEDKEKELVQEKGIDPNHTEDLKSVNIDTVGKEQTKNESPLADSNEIVGIEKDGEQEQVKSNEATMSCKEELKDNEGSIETSSTTNRLTESEEILPNNSELQIEVQSLVETNSNEEQTSTAEVNSTPVTGDVKSAIGASELLAEDKTQLPENTQESADSAETVDKNTKDSPSLSEGRIDEMSEDNKMVAETTNNNNQDQNNDTRIPVRPNTTNCEDIAANENKRKISVNASNDVTIKKAKLDTKHCVRPNGVKKTHNGATFWPLSFRQKLCTCNECLSIYKDLSVLFLIDPEDTVTAYETLGKERIDGGPTTQYEKGLEALSSLDRIQQINALTEYNKMRDKLLDFLKSFKDRKEIVKEEDIKAFFAGMKPKREPDGVYFCR